MRLLFALAVIAVFAISYTASFFVISLTPYGHYSVRVYSMPEAAPTELSNSSYWAGAWQNELIYLGPETGATNVPCDTSIIIEGLRPVQPVNVSFSPTVSIDKVTYKINSGFGPSSTQSIYPIGLLEPNITYNVSATVNGTPSWWTFTTSSEPSHLSLDYPLTSYDVWVALITAFLITTTFISTIVLKGKRLF